MRESLTRERYLACRSCLELRRLVPDLPDDEEDPFVVRHEGHRVELVSRLGEAFLSDRPVWDPMATTYFEVTNGCEVFMVRSERRSMEEPLQRKLVPGRLRLDHVTVDFELDLLARAIDAQFFPHALRPVKLEQLLSFLRAACEQIRPEELDIVFDSADDPQVHYARIPDDLFAGLLARCESVFDAWEYERLRRLLEAERADDGLLCLRVTRAFVVEAA